MLDFKQKEKEILEFWEKNKIYEKSKKKNSKGKKFYMMDGPPYATGSIHLGTALNKILKDIAMRSQRMQGKDVFDRPGYDTHGVPIEFQIEKEIGSTSKKDIEKYGVEKFVQRCKEFASQYINVMNEQFENLGVWMDWANPYVTFADDYVEAIWHAFKEADNKDLLYLGEYPVHVCPRCETAVAYNEIEYTKQKDSSIFVKFPLKKKKDTFLIIWTSTPWTLPGNTGVMVNPSLIYQEIETAEGDRWIIVKSLVSKVMAMLERGFTIKKEFKGKEMEGWAYENPLAKNLRLNLRNAYKVILSERYVTDEDGTGLVHCAPGHGKEDFEVGREYQLDMPSPVNSNGLLTEEAGKYAGKKAREVDREIIEDLKKDRLLVHELSFHHDYPVCWRDKTPLLMIAQPQWFLKISKIHKKLLEENEKNTWIPDWMKSRMKAWLDGIGDWPVSRQRYWGTPLPIWYNPDTGEKIVVGSIEELRKLSGKDKIGVHKPAIDEITLKGKSGKLLKRVPEVLDVWFDSGVSSWAALGYPAKKELFNKFWPSDLNVEGKDQVRGWWNSQLILSVIAFNKKPFENILVHGMVLDIEKRKLSKSLGNNVSPENIISKYGRDAMRYYFAKNSKGEDFAFDEREFVEIQKVLTILSNINNFVVQLDKEKAKLQIEDLWILSKYSALLKDVTEDLNKFFYPEAIQKLEKFIVHDLSRAYIQMIRDRASESFAILNEIRDGLIKLFSPICPFITENIWQELRKKGIVKEESIHLSDWPKFDKKKISVELEKEFDNALSIIELGLAERDKAKISLRWPLAKAIIYSNVKLKSEIQEIIAKQLNVKRVEVKTNQISEKKSNSVFKVELDTNMTPELEAEGFARELARKVQSERKNSGLVKKDKISISLWCDSDVKDILQKHLSFLQERINAKKIEFIDGEIPKEAIVFTIKEKKIYFFFRNF